ncbi:MAG: hypothetical protein ACM3SS_15995 [Rhodospirillaceae bacterium]
MPKTTISVGSGITQRSKTVYINPDEQLEYFKRLATMPGNALDLIVHRAVKHAEAVLREANIDPNSQLPSNDDSPQDYALRIVSLYKMTQAAVQTTDANGAASLAAQLGATITEAHMKFAWEEAALRGQKFAGNKRGLSRLYSEALKVLEEHGKNHAAKKVAEELEKRGVLHAAKPNRNPRETAPRWTWMNNHGCERTVTLKQFQNELTRVRRRVAA